MQWQVPISREVNAAEQLASSQDTSSVGGRLIAGAILAGSQMLLPMGQANLVCIHSHGRLSCLPSPGCVGSSSSGSVNNCNVVHLCGHTCAAKRRGMSTCCMVRKGYSMPAFKCNSEAENRTGSTIKCQQKDENCQLSPAVYSHCCCFYPAPRQRERRQLALRCQLRHQPLQLAALILGCAWAAVHDLQGREQRWIGGCRGGPARWQGCGRTLRNRQCSSMYSTAQAVQQHAWQDTAA